MPKHTQKQRDTKQLRQGLSELCLPHCCLEGYYLNPRTPPPHELRWPQALFPVKLLTERFTVFVHRMPVQFNMYVENLKIGRISTSPKFF